MLSRYPYGATLELKADLWRVPLLMCLSTLLLLLATVRIDAAAVRGAIRLPSWLSIGGADDARAILGAMLGTVSTVLALIFSVALLVLSMAVSQFGPRNLYRFVRDGITPVTNRGSVFSQALRRRNTTDVGTACIPPSTPQPIAASLTHVSNFQAFSPEQRSLGIPVVHPRTLKLSLRQVRTKSRPGV